MRVGLLAFGLWLALAAGGAGAQEPRFEPQACTDPQVEEAARCGVIRVPEDRNAPRNRAIDLNVVILPGGGHILDGLSGIDTCLDPLLVAFLDHGDPVELDSNCLASVNPPPFLASPPAEWGMNSPAG